MRVVFGQQVDSSSSLSFLSRGCRTELGQATDSLKTDEAMGESPSSGKGVGPTIPEERNWRGTRQWKVAD